MPRYKPIYRSPRLLPVVLPEQIQSGSFEFALNHLVDHELNLTDLDAKFNNDETGERWTCPLDAVCRPKTACEAGYKRL